MLIAARFVLCLIALLAVAGCYETKEEIFGADQGVAVPGLEGRYATSVNEYTVTRIPESNDYSFTDAKHAEDGAGRLRAMAITSDLYLVQLHLDEWADGVSWQVVFRVIRKGAAIERIVRMEPDDKTADMLAAKNEVQLTVPEGNGTADPKVPVGTTSRIADFLKTLAATRLKEASVYRRME